MARRGRLVLDAGRVPTRDEMEVRWLISYSDFMMQLVCLFILLYSVSSFDREKMSLVVAYYRASIGHGEPPVHEPASRGRNLAIGDRPIVPSTPGRAELPPGLRYSVEQIPGGWVIRFQETAFAAGSSTVGPDLGSDLDAIASRVRAYAGTVSVTATAAPAPADAVDSDALRLAGARAEAVASYLAREGGPSPLDARFLHPAGRATSAAEARRIDIVVRVK